MHAQVVGRDELLARIDRFVEGLDGASARLTLEGEPGIGKTSVWERAVEAARERGYLVLVSRPAEAEAALAYSGLADLLEAVDPTAFDELPEPQRRALRVALHLSDPGERPSEPRAVFAGLGAVLRALAATAPVLVAVDDRQWLDRSSMRAIDFVARRLEGTRIGIVATVRAGRDEPPAARAAGTEVIRLGPLSAAALHALIKNELGISLPRSSALRVHRMTGGNPFFAVEVVQALGKAGLPGARDPWPVPDDLGEMVADRVARLPESVRSALLVAAAGSRSTISGLGADEARAASDAGVVTIGDTKSVRFTHPLYAAAVYRAATDEERRDVHAALAGRNNDIEEQARHRALACDGPDEKVAELLDRAAAWASGRGAPDVAAELAERAAALTPPEPADRPTRRAIDAAEYHFRAGDLEPARDQLAEIVARLPAQNAPSAALRLLAEVCYRLRHLDEAMRYLREAIAAANGDPAESAAAEMDLAYVLFLSFGSFEEAGAAANRALAAAESRGERSLLAGALAASASAELMLGRGLDEARLDRALSLEDMADAIPAERRPSYLAGWACLLTDQLDRARGLCGSLRAHLVDSGQESDLPEVLSLLALVECTAGRLTAALEVADEGYELARQAGSDSQAATAMAIRALVLAHAGRVDDCRAAAAESIALADRSGWQVASFWASTALAHLELAGGENAAVVETLARSIELAENEGIGEPSRRPFLPDAIEALVRLGQLERADRLAEELGDAGSRLGRSWAILASARCRALVLAARNEPGEALAVLERALNPEHEAARRLELARTLLVKGQLERRRKNKRAARESLERALTLCEEMGAELWAARAQAELARVGVSPRPSELTPTEARVASLAASGLTNREIATAAFMSPKTVEANLSRAYRKLGIRSRAELGVRLATGEGPSREPRERDDSGG